jgi:hypothetical protein
MKKVILGLAGLVFCLLVSSSALAQDTGFGQATATHIEHKMENRVVPGIYTTQNGRQLQVQEQDNNRTQLRTGNVSAQTSMVMTHEEVGNLTRLQVNLSNGRKSEVKVMPDVACERAIEQLRIRVCSEENGCRIELKEVGQGEQAKAVYEVQAQKRAKILWLFETRMQVMAQVDAENGEIIQVQRPWWAFLAVESEE